VRGRWKCGGGSGIGVVGRGRQAINLMEVECVWSDLYSNNLRKLP